MKVLVVDPSLFTPLYNSYFCRALANSGASVTLVGRPIRRHEQLTGDQFPFADLFYRGTSQHELGWRTSHLGRIRKGFEHAFGLWALNRLVTEQEVDIVHFQWLVLPFFDRIALRQLRRRCGLVLTVHNAEMAAHDSKSAVGKLGAAFQSLGQKNAVLEFDRYIVHSARALNQLVTLGIGPERIIHLPHPPFDVTATTVLPAATEVSERREILLFGQIKPYKGVDVLIDAGIAMAASRRDFRITIAGRPYQSLDEARSRIASAGVEDVFRFDLSYVSDTKLAEYLSAATLVVFPYRDIDGSGALSHAIHFGKPIVASRVGGFAESPFKDHIELVPPGDPGALAATLGELLDDPVRIEALARRTRILGSMLPTWDDFASVISAAYYEIAPKRERR